MHRLFLRDPPLAFADHVHLNGAGYAATADVLFFDLINAYEDWKRGAGLASQEQREGRSRSAAQPPICRK
jgi:hypothetical protein